MNFTGRPAKVSLPEGTDALTGENTGRPAKVSLPEGTDALTGENIGGETELPVNDIRIVRTVPE